MEIEPVKDRQSPDWNYPVRIPKGQLEGVVDFDPPSVGFRRGPNGRGRGYRLILFSWAATAIDVLLGSASNAIFIMISSMAMRVDFHRWVEFFGGSLLRLSMVSFLGSVILYQMLLRMFLGFTIGEWACGLRLGSTKERLSGNYAFRVFLRSMVNIVSGFILLPFLSLIFGQDLAGRISGLYLVTTD